MAVHNDLIDKEIDKFKKYTHLQIQTTILNYAVRKSECNLKKLLSNNEVVDYRDNIYCCLCRKYRLRVEVKWYHHRTKKVIKNGHL